MLLADVSYPRPIFYPLDTLSHFPIVAYPNKGVLKIGDGPNKDTYGWLACNKRRVSGESNIYIADCITFLVHAIYLSQIHGIDTFWTTGEVDLKNSHPQYLST